MTISQFTDDFVKKYKGKTLGYPNSNNYKGECLSLCKHFIKEYYKIYPPASGCNGARCYWSKFPNPLGTVLKKVPNTLDLIPKKGWIVVWNKKVGLGFGHIAIILEANVNTFVSFDQNYRGKHAHKVTHNYNNVYGFLIPKSMPENTQDKIYTEAEMSKMREERDKNWSLYQAEKQKSASLLNETQRLENAVKDVRSQLGGSKAEAKDIRAKLDNFRDKVAQKIGSISDESKIMEKLEMDIATQDNIAKEVVKLEKAIDIAEKVNKNEIATLKAELLAKNEELDKVKRQYNNLLKRVEELETNKPEVVATNNFLEWIKKVLKW